MPKGFEINEQGMREMERRLQQRFSKMRLTVPVQAEVSDSGLADAISSLPDGGGNIIVVGDRAQIVSNSQNVVQAHENSIVRPEFGPISLAVTQLLESLDQLALTDEDRELARDTATDVLGEVTKADPDRGRLRRWLATLRGVLVPLAAGAAEGATSEIIHMLQLPS
jgi:hypothetical protein